MKKKFGVIIIAVVLLIGGMVTSFASDYGIAYDSSYDADTNLVSVSVYITNAVGVQSGSVFLTYDMDMYEYEDTEEATGSSVMLAAGQTIDDESLLSCAFMFANQCTESDCDEDGNLQLATYSFTPLTEDFDLDDFYLQVGSFDVDDVDIRDEIEAQGNAEHEQDENDIIVSYDTGSDSSDDDSGTKWYVYVIVAVIAVAVVACVVVLVVRSNRMEEDEDGEKDEHAEIADDNETTTVESAEGENNDESENNAGSEEEQTDKSGSDTPDE